MLCSLQDRAEIDDLVAHYFQALNLHRFDELAEVFTEDAIFDFSEETGVVYRRVADIIDFIRQGVASHTASQLHTSIFRVWSTGPDTAEGYGHVANNAVKPGYNLPAPGRASVVMTGSYSDKYVRTPVGWRIASRYFTAISIFGSADGFGDTTAGQVFARIASGDAGRK
jgi:SnoaL-like domain